MRPLRTCLLIVDLQHGFVNEHNSHVLDSISGMIDQFDFVIATKFFNPEGSMFRDSLEWDGMVSEDDTRLVDIALDRANLIIEKETYTPYDIERVLDHLNAGEVTVVGLDTDTCVLATAMYLFDKHVDVKVDLRACGSSGGQNCHEFGSEILLRNLGRRRVIFDDL